MRLEIKPGCKGVEVEAVADSDIGFLLLPFAERPESEDAKRIDSGFMKPIEGDRNITVQIMIKPKLLDNKNSWFSSNMLLLS
ncbi:hypothetical protein CSA56_01450 [candidate division KSB3 bacterium]|uniref:Uncharacterized protein n=1 Tax=candidate division KSB3 bacterium TaxID=2044937 RepID=A0A2G6KKC1_9BACT|nr:MAG: hypothetical protein CSA56_01450 [candidate division KSB3 bacterium]